MSIMAREFDTESLISAVESRKHLWDASHEEYKDRELRAKAWNDIAANLVPDFGNLDEAEQKRFVEKIQKRWKTARDAYFKSRNKISPKKSGSGATKVSKYTYHDQLSFLDRMRESQTESNFDVPQDTECNDDLTQDDEPQTDDNTARPAENDFRRKRPMGNRAFEDTLIKLLEDSKEKEEDDDRAFLISLMPFLRSFNQDQKLLFRSQVLQLVMSIKRGNQANINMQPPILSHYPHNYRYQPLSFHYGPQSANQNYPNQFIQYQQDSPITTSTRVPSPAPSAASTTSWETM